MNKAIIFINDANERRLAVSPLLGKRIIDIVVNELNRLDLDDIYLIGGQNIEILGLKKRNNINEIKKELGDCKKVLLLSPLYPLMNKEDYKLVLNELSDAAVVIDNNNDLCSIYSINADMIEDFDTLKYKTIKFVNQAKRFNDISLLSDFNSMLSKRINNLLIEKGVRLIDSNNTYIGPDVQIDCNTIIYPNTFIEGKCSIGKNNIIQSNTYIESSIIGDNNVIEPNVNISCSTIHDDCYISHNARIHEHSEILDKVKIGKGTDISNSKLSKEVKVSNLSYLDSVGVGEETEIGTSVVVVADKNIDKYSTLIGTNSIIGSHSTLIAPVKIGNFCLVAAGSTIDTNIDNGDMGISRLYQTNKIGYGYKNHNKGK